MAVLKLFKKFAKVERLGRCDPLANISTLFKKTKLFPRFLHLQLKIVASRRPDGVKKREVSEN